MFANIGESALCAPRGSSLELNLSGRTHSRRWCVYVNTFGTDRLTSNTSPGAARQFLWVLASPMNVEPKIPKSLQCALRIKYENTNRRQSNRTHRLENNQKHTHIEHRAVCVEHRKWKVLNNNAFRTRGSKEQEREFDWSVIIIIICH